MRCSPNHVARRCAGSTLRVIEAQGGPVQQRVEHGNRRCNETTGEGVEIAVVWSQPIVMGIAPRDVKEAAVIAYDTFGLTG